MKIPTIFRDIVTVTSRRNFMKRFLLGGGLIAASGGTLAQSEESSEPEEELRFPGDPTEHNVVYQFNKADPDYHQAVIFSVGEMIRTYGDNIRVVVVALGPGIHILGKKPKRPVAKEIQERVSSLAAYGVEFHACGNTMAALKWKKEDLHDFVKVVHVGAADLMELQEKGFSYISW